MNGLQNLRRGVPLHLWPPSFQADYMYYQGGELSFGKTTMHGADLEIIDADPKDPFDFFLAYLRYV
jgi:hypothetical protein